MHFYELGKDLAKWDTLFQFVNEGDTNIFLKASNFQYLYFEKGSRPQFASYPIQVIHFKRKRFYDLGSMYGLGNWIFSDKFFKTVANYSLTGLNAHPTITYNKNGSIMEKGYYLPYFTSKCSILSYENAKKINDHPSVLKIGAEVDLTTWDGSDFFSCKNAGGFFCTEKVKKAFEIENISNVRFTPLSEFEWHNYHLKLLNEKNNSQP